MSIADQNLKHEVGLTQWMIDMELDLTKITRFKNVTMPFNHDAEYGQHAFEYDRNTEPMSQVKTRLLKMKDTPFKVIFIVPTVERLWSIGNAAECLGDRVLFTIPSARQRFIGHNGSPVSVVLSAD